jgi:hypothetical protein
LINHYIPTHGRRSANHDGLLALVLMVLIGSATWLAGLAVDHWDIALPVIAFAGGIGAALAWRAGRP